MRSVANNRCGRACNFVSIFDRQTGVFHNSMAKLIHKLSLIRLILACFKIPKRIQHHFKQLYAAHKRSEPFFEFRLLKSVDACVGVRFLEFCYLQMEIEKSALNDCA